MNTARKINVDFKSPLLLTTNEITDYQKNGFLVLENFIPTAICELLMERANKLVEQFDPSEIKISFSTKNPTHSSTNYFMDSGDKIRFFLEENALDQQGELTRNKFLAINKIGHALHDLDPVFNCFSRRHSIAQLIADLGIEDPLLVQSMYIFKQPLIGGEVSCHQDSTYLYIPTQPIIGLWFALQDATINNGCLWAIPGGHHTALKSRVVRNDDNTTAMEVYDDSEWSLDKMVPLEVKRGSLIVLHGLLPHMSKENNSPHSRHAYTLHVMSRQFGWSPQNWLQRGPSLPFRGFF